MSLKGEQHYYTLGMVCLFISKTGFNFINVNFIFYHPLKLLRVKIRALIKWIKIRWLYLLGNTTWASPNNKKDRRAQKSSQKRVESAEHSRDCKVWQSQESLQGRQSPQSNVESAEHSRVWQSTAEPKKPEWHIGPYFQSFVTIKTSHTRVSAWTPTPSGKWCDSLSGFRHIVAAKWSKRVGARAARGWGRGLHVETISANKPCSYLLLTTELNVALVREGWGVDRKWSWGAGYPVPHPEQMGGEVLIKAPVTSCVAVAFKTQWWENLRWQARRRRVFGSFANAPLTSIRTKTRSSSPSPA